MGITNEVTMKKCLVAAFCCFNALMLQPVQAGDGHGGGLILDAGRVSEKEHKKDRCLKKEQR